MDLVFMLKGLVLIIYVPQRNYSQRWVEITLLRNKAHTSEFTVTTVPSHTGCIALCTSTLNCAYAAYNNDTGTCLRHQQLQGEQDQSNTRVWEKESICAYPFSYIDDMGCIFGSVDRLKWEDAKVECERIGGRLLVANINDKFHAVQTSITQYGLFWVGGYPRTPDGVWVWLTGDLFNHTMFQPNQPSGGPGRLAFWKSGGAIKLDDTFPHERHYYVCESL